MKQYLILFILLQVSVMQAGIDPSSVYARVHSVDDPAEKLDTIYKVAHQLSMIAAWDSAQHYLQYGIEIGKKYTLPQKMIPLQIDLARVYEVQGRFREAIDLSLSARDKLGEDAGIRLASLYKHLGRYYSNYNMPDSSIHYFILAEEIFKNTKPYYNWALYSQWAQVYRKQGIFDKAFEYMEKARAITAEKMRRMDHGLVLYRLQELAGVAGDLERYARYRNEYLEFSDKGRDNLNADDVHQLFLPDQERDKQSKYQLMVGLRKVALENNYRSALVEINNQLAYYYFEEGEYDKALPIVQQNIAFFKEPQHLLYLNRHLKLLYEIAKKAGKYQLAIESADQLLAYRDSLQSVQKSELALELEEKYESAKKDNEITLLNTQNEIKDLRISTVNKQRMIFLVAILGLLALVISLIFLFRNKQKSNEILAEKNKIIAANLKEKEFLIKEIHHRVKNNLQIISSLLSLQSRSVADEVAVEALTDGQNRVQSMALIHQNLYKEDNLTGVEVKDYIEKLCRNLFSSYNIEPERVKLELQIDPISLDVSTLIPMGLILNELFTNSLKYAFPEGRSGTIGVELIQQADGIFLKVWDDGIGYDNGKSSLSNERGFGSRLIRTFAKKLRAELDIRSHEGTVVQMLIKNYKVA